MLNLLSSDSSGRAEPRPPRGAWLSIVAMAVAGALALGAPAAHAAGVRDFRGYGNPGARGAPAPMLLG